MTTLDGKRNTADDSSERDELLDALEFCEGALSDHCYGEDGLDVETSTRIVLMCSDLLVKHRRTSVIVESRKQPES